MPKKRLHRKPGSRDRRLSYDAIRLLDDKPRGRPDVGPLRGKVAVITGASRGIGLAIATALAAEECDLVLTARNTSVLKRASEMLSRTARVRVIVKACDVRDAKQVNAVFTAVAKRFSRVDILINNAGISHAMSPTEKIPVDTWKDVLATNLDGTFHCVRAALPLMKKGGIIVNNLSVAATTVFDGQAAYIASKWGARGLTNALREELRPRGIRVVGLFPGAADTEIWNQFWPDAPRDQMMRPEHVAQAVLAAINMPAQTAVDEIHIGPTSGKL